MHHGSRINTVIAHFRAIIGAALLKLLIASRGRLRRLLFPRYHWRGPIEALHPPRPGR